MPCYLQKSDAYKERKVMTTLYFNPEYDFIHLKAERGLWSYPSVVDFLHDFKAHDPRGVGLINLAIGRYGMKGLHAVTDIPVAPKAKEILVDFLSRVEEVLFVAHSPTSRSIREMWDVPFRGGGVGIRFNHSMPVMGFTPGFNLFRRDPRPVGPELKYVLTADSKPRQMPLLWRDLLERLEVRAQPPRERVLSAFKVRSDRKLVIDIETADQFLGPEEEDWLAAQQRRHRVRVMRYTGREPPIEGPEELAKAVRPAIGFWLFPVEALGDLERQGPPGSDDGLFDMSDHWPELALSVIH
jgi:hypothetical protein